MGRHRLIPDDLLKLPLVGKGSSTQHVDPCHINGQSCTQLMSHKGIASHRPVVSTSDLLEKLDLIQSGNQATRK
jgi:hypothetical protein